MPLETEFVVTDAVRFPREVGSVSILTVSTVAVAAVTVPTAPLLNVTVLFNAVVSNANPLIVMLVALLASVAVLRVTLGSMRATCTGEPLDLVFVVTTAVIFPTLVGLVPIVTVSVVAVAAVTVPVAPLLSVTTLLPGVVSKPAPVIVSVLSEADRFVVVAVTTGVTEAICTAVPLRAPLEVTMAVRIPALGLVENVTVSEVAVAAVTAPIAPLLKRTRLLASVVLKFVPANVTVEASAASVAEVFSVTVGAVTFAISVAT